VTINTTTAEMAMPEGAPAEVVTHARRRDIDLGAFGASGTLALITLDNGLDYMRPNTFGPAGLMELGALLDEAAKDSSITAVAVHGKQFILAAGADLSALSYVTDAKQAEFTGKLGHDVFRKLGELGKPTFALINGLALGGGLEVALHCTYRTIASTATIGLPEVFLGLVPGWGGAYLLPRLIGPEKAVEVIIANPLKNNTMLQGPQALELGIADAIFEPADFLERSVQWVAKVLNGQITPNRPDFTSDENAWNAAMAKAEAIVAKKYRGAPVAAPAKAIELMAAARTSTRDQGFDAEDVALTNLVMSDALRASIYSFNLVQKKAKKIEGAPKSNQARKVTHFGVVGAGLMASQLALLIMRRIKMPVVITDLDQERVDKGLAWIHGEIDKLVAKGRMSEDQSRRMKGLVSGSTDQQIFANCGFIIEAVFEDMKVKKELFANLEKIVSPECILATNTSSLSVEEMARDLNNPERVVGFHFFNPVAVMPLLEVVRTSKSDDASIATAVEVGKKLKKTQVIVSDAPAFVVNRLLNRFMGEVTAALDEGTPLDVAERALQPLGLPMTPFELLNLVGPGVAYHVSEILNKELGPRFKVSENLRRIVEQNIREVYSVDASGNAAPSEAAKAVVQYGSSPSSEEQVRDRALSSIAEEARMMIDEGVVAGPAEIDLCMLLGAGWPFHIGGITPYLDREGISERVTGKRFHDHGVASVPR
jgi:3-hydroxyacyl-CoA dehydrogenase/enoyl-CoA hydratase/carnithine racemase